MIRGPARFLHRQEGRVMNDRDSDESTIRRLGIGALRVGTKLGKQALSAGGMAVQHARRAAGWSRDAFDRWVEEDESAILTECSVVKGMLSRRSQFDADPEVFGLLYNVHLRPLVSAAALLGAGTGINAFEEVLSRLTRTV